MEISSFVFIRHVCMRSFVQVTTLDVEGDSTQYDEADDKQTSSPEP
jgi:hypothetical protein